MNGFILYRGPSLIDGAPIVCILTGVNRGSKNSKTGDLLQTWIIREDMHPVDAIRSGADSSICGDCPHRGNAGKERSCYVLVHNAPAQVFKAFGRGSYGEFDDAAAALVKGRGIRFGSYGDPAAVPVSVWQRLAGLASFWTGYTHQWANSVGKALRPYCMASVDSEAEHAQAIRLGWRTFRVALPGDRQKLAGEAVCPASKESAAGLSCAECKACGGANGRRGTIVIAAHGGMAVMSGVRKLAQRLSA